MTESAGRAYNRARRSGTSSEEAWERAKELGTEYDWRTAWMESREESSQLLHE